MNLTGMALLRSHRGLMTKIAAELGIERGAVAMWKRIPPDRVPAVAKITGFSRHELRPDLWDKEKPQAPEPPEPAQAAA